MPDKGLTDKIIEYSCSLGYDDLTEGAAKAQKNSLKDMLGVMLAATGLDSASKPFALYGALSGPGKCTILGRSEKTGPAMAALANGALVHALDFEDSHEFATVHPNSSALPALMALSQHIGGISGKEFISAMAVASDICCRLDLGAGEDFLKYGWNMPPVHGCMGAVLGAARLLKLNEAKTKDAFTLAMNSAVSSGEASNSRSSSMRTVREGFSAQAAVQSALLAELGTTAAFDYPLEGKLGYYHMYARDNYDPEVITKDLGRVFQGEYISFKPWPCCRATHTTIEGLLKIMKDNSLSEEDISSVEITLQEIGRMVTEPSEIKYRPGSASIAKFSLPFIAATAMRFKSVGLGSFTKDRLNDTKTLKAADKVKTFINPDWTKAQNKFTDISVKDAKGNDYFLHLEDPLGSVTHPMSPQDFALKFEGCAAEASRKYTPQETEKILYYIENLQELEDVNTLFSLL